jgi:excisionase family DNA binding protein
LETSSENVVKARRPAEACKVLRISRSTLYRRIDDGTLKAVKLGGVRLITEDSINAIVQAA